MRALRRNPALVCQLAHGLLATVDGLPTRGYYVDKQRLERTLSSIARAIYFHHYDEKWTDQIEVLCPALFAVEGPNSQETNSCIQRLKLMTDKMFENKPRHGENQEIFYYQVYKDEESNDAWMRMVFYDGFVVIAFSADITQGTQDDV